MDNLPVFETEEFWGYNVSSLALWFGNLTRYGTNFQPVKVSLLNDEKAYFNALIMYGVFAAVAAVILTLVLLVSCCCKCICNSAKRKSVKPRRKVTSGVVIVLIATLCAATFTASFIGRNKVNDGLDIVCDALDFLVKNIRTVREMSENLMSQLELDSTMKNLTSEIDQANKAAEGMSPDIQQQVKQFSQYYDDIEKNVLQSSSTVREQIKTQLLDDALRVLVPLKNDLRKYKEVLFKGNLAGFIVCTVFSFIFVIGLCNNCFRSTGCVFGYIFFNIAVVLGIVFFFCLIFASDFCQTSKPLLEKYLDTPILGYYFYCPQDDQVQLYNNYNNNSTLSEINNDVRIDLLIKRVQQYMETAKTKVDDLLNEVSKVQSICQQSTQSSANLCSHLNSINSVVSDLTTSVDNVQMSVTFILASVNCLQITPHIDLLITGVCTPIYEAFFYFFCNFTAASFCYFFLILLTIYMLS